jgi:nitroreductase/Pyruvate/2-oxoacid:ferredoxin oxidoreductase delta subunit
MARAIDTTIDGDLCTGCGECVRVCPTTAITMVGEQAVVTGELSLGCGHCAAVCPVDAVNVGFIDDDWLQLETVTGVAGYCRPGELDTATLVGLMRSRRSCRSYEERLVPPEVLRDLVRIGTTAPSGTNSQLWTFTILPDREAVLVLAEAVRRFFVRLNRRAANPLLRTVLRPLGSYYRNHFESVEEGLRQWHEEGRDRLFHGAPAVILVGARPGASCPQEDALLASQNMLLAAHSMGLGTCLIGFVVSAIANDPRIKGEVGIPDEEAVHAAIALGYPDQEYLHPAGRRQVQPRWYGR